MAGSDQEDDIFEDLMGEDTSVSGDADAGKPADDADGDASLDPSKPKDGAAEDDQDDADKDKSPKNGDDDDADEDDDKDSKKEDAKDKMVPKAALDSAKRRLRETNARLKRIEDRFAAVDAEVERAQIPDPTSQPAEHAQYLAVEARKANINERLNFSEYHARKTHGDETVSTAFDWANAQMEDPATGAEFAKKLLSHADPYDYAVELHKKAQEADTSGGAASKDPEYEEFKAWKASQTAAPAAPNQPAAAARPRSLAQRGSAAGPKGDDIVVDPFDSEFGR